MNWNTINLEEKIDEYLEVMDKDFISKIKSLYEKIYEKKFGQYSLLDKKELKEDLFNNSVFLKVFNEDPDYAFEKSEEYWANHIIKEISNNLNLEALEAFEKNKIMEEVKPIPLSIVATLDNFTRSTRFYLSQNFIKNFFDKTEKEISININTISTINITTASTMKMNTVRFRDSLEELDLDASNVNEYQLGTTSLSV